MKALFRSLVLAAAFSSVALAQMPTTDFVREPNTVALDKGGSCLEFPKAKDGRLSFAVTWVEGNSRTTVSKPQEGFFKKDGWFVYVESPTRVWLFDGIGQLDLVTKSKSQSGIYSVTTKGVFETCPQKVWDAIPDSLRRNLHGKRPS